MYFNDSSIENFMTVFAWARHTRKNRTPITFIIFVVMKTNINLYLLFHSTRNITFGFPFIRLISNWDKQNRKIIYLDLTYNDLPGCLVILSLMFPLHGLDQKRDVFNFKKRDNCFVRLLLHLVISFIKYSPTIN